MTSALTNAVTGSWLLRNVYTHYTGRHHDIPDVGRAISGERIERIRRPHVLHSQTPGGVRGIGAPEDCACHERQYTILFLFLGQHICGLCVSLICMGPPRFLLQGYGRLLMMYSRR